MLSASLPVSVSYHIRGCLLNVLWQHFKLGGLGYTIIHCSLPECPAYLHRAPPEFLYPHGLGLAPVILAIISAFITAIVLTGRVKYSRVNVFVCLSAWIHLCVRVCVCGQMAQAGLTVCELSLEESTCKEKQKEDRPPEPNTCCWAVIVVPLDQC